MEHQIKTVEQLRGIMGEPVHPILYEKSATRLTDPIKRFIELSPFLTLATHSADGKADVSPRGDAPGFVHMPDDRTLVIPDRPGNKRLDSVINIIDDGNVAILFMVPGVRETVRVNGTAIVSTDPSLLKPFAVNGKLPQLVLVVSVTEAFGHCSKAFRRSKLWESDYLVSDGAPTLAEMMESHLELEDITHEMLVAGIEEDAKELY